MSSQNSNFQTDFKCSKCEDTGWLSNILGVVRCECWKHKIQQIRLSKVPERFVGITLDNYKEKTVFLPYINQERILPKDFLPQENYFMAGKLRSGKTTLLWTQYQQLIQLEKNCYADVESEMLKKLQEQKYQDIQYFNYEAKNLHFFIDDLATTKYTEDRTTLLYELIDLIYRSKFGLTITSNYRMKDLKESQLLGQNTTRILRRIHDMCTVIYFDREDK